MNVEQVKQFGYEYIHYDFAFWALNMGAILSVITAAVVFIRQLCPKIPTDNPPREQKRVTIDVPAILSGIVLFLILPLYIVGLIVIFVVYEVIR